MCASKWRLNKYCSYFGNRSSSQDLDYFLDSASFGKGYEGIRAEMQRLIGVTARNLKYDIRWANDEVRVFLSLLHSPERLFSRSKAQNIVLYDDGTLKVYAVQMEWALCRKMKRLQMENQVPRREDWSDCVAITKFLFDKSGSVLSPKLFKQFDDTQREPPVYTKTILMLKQHVSRIHQRDVFPPIGWVFKKSTNTLEYKWLDRDGTQHDSSINPDRTGIHQVACVEEKQFKSFNFDKNAWEPTKSSTPLEKSDNEDGEEDSDNEDGEEDSDNEDGEEDSDNDDD
jgi:hypothetical protein